MQDRRHRVTTIALLFAFVQVFGTPNLRAQSDDHLHMASSVRKKVTAPRWRACDPEVARGEVEQGYPGNKYLEDDQK